MRRLLACLAILVVPAVARADDTAPLAEALFREGRELMAAHRVSEACPKLAESQRLDPKLGTLLNLATCHELEGRTATAWVELTSAEQEAKRLHRAEYEKFARTHLDRLEPKLVRLTIHSDDKTVSVTLDDKRVGAEAFDTAFPVDPGAHTVAASRADRKPWSMKVQVEAAPITVTVPALEAVAQAPAPPPVVVAPVPPPPPPAPEPDHSRRNLGFVAFGAAAVGIGLGTYFGIKTFNDKSDGNQHCHGDLCTQEGLDDQSSAHTAAVISTIAFGIGLAAAAIGVYALVTSSPPSMRAAANGLVLQW